MFKAKPPAIAAVAESNRRRFAEQIVIGANHALPNAEFNCFLTGLMQNCGSFVFVRIVHAHSCQKAIFACHLFLVRKEEVGRMSEIGGARLVAISQLERLAADMFCSDFRPFRPIN
jgi:hypothetical protein